MTNSSGTFTIAALGDSISTAFNAELTGDNERHSWVTGTEPAASGGSHLQRLARLFPNLTVRAVNVAVSGSRAADLRGQVDRLTASTVPDYATLLIGANDLSHWLMGETGTMMEQFFRDVRQAVARVIALNARVMILVVAVPDQAQVLAHLIENGVSLPPGLLEPLRRVYRERWRAMNQGLEAVAHEFRRNVRFAPALAAAQIGADHLSLIDRYHPSVQGQKLLAALTWSDGYFPHFQD